MLDPSDAAASCAGVSITSPPFSNVTQSTTLGNWFSCFSRCNILAAAMTSLKNG